MSVRCEVAKLVIFTAIKHNHKLLAGTKKIHIAEMILFE